ncbi:hypothetical protein MTQ13_12335 [Streptomyces sp. XM4011]|uniref:hypothetical protein n=1 Tax=Streptomyces sp. XM4011 TaxID=2929780 RepID=UPI001FFA71A0|nr:hypothetical protein [Streptomyces sp. XM4011]MCK1815057.1 hypothetical protein [Streptomyces sp. XM4011]
MKRQLAVLATLSGLLLASAPAVAAPVASGPSSPSVASGASATAVASGAPDAPAHTPGRPPLPALPDELNGGAWPTSHLQGVALDREKRYMYWSFTQMLVKTDLRGRVVGTVEGLTGHLGDLDLNPRDGRVYGSLEYKAEEAFYIAIFDGDRINRVGMNAERDGVMTTVYLPEVVEDFTADMDGDGHFDGDTPDTADHRYGCSGIDGVAFGPAFGKRAGQGKDTLKVAYGIYSNTERTDNDHQVILEYDVTSWRRYERPLSQTAPHHSGPSRVDGKFFAYTGNTRYGVQNLEYDPYTGDWFLAVYEGAKPGFPNYSFFVIDGSARPVTGEIVGQPERERGKLLKVADGFDFHGQYGFQALGDGTYYVADSVRVVGPDGVARQEGFAEKYRWTGRPAGAERTTPPFSPVVGG